MPRPWPYAVGTTKFVLMSLFTMGFYNVYWFYWNWRRQHDLKDASVRAGLRTFFSPVTAYLLFRDIRADPRARATWNPLLLAVVYFVMLMSFIVPGWWWILTWLSFLPLLPLQRSINVMHADDPTAIDVRITAANIAVMFAGALIMAMFVTLGVALDRGLLVVPDVY